MAGELAMKMLRLKLLPRPLRPMKRRSLNLATLFFRLDNKIFRVPGHQIPSPTFMTAVLLRSSPQKFSSLPALSVTTVPSHTSLRATTCPGLYHPTVVFYFTGKGIRLAMLMLRLCSG